MSATRPVRVGGVCRTLLLALGLAAAFCGDADGARPQSAGKPAAGPKASETGYINFTWDGEPTGHPPANVSLVGKPGYLEIVVTAPYFGDKAPVCKASCPKLWDYEVVEVFFLGGPADKPQYLQVDLGPQGNYYVLLLEGDGKVLSQGQQLKYETESSIEGKGPGTWTGTAQVPISYFPPNVRFWNTYAMHNDPKSATGDGRAYWSMSSAPKGKYPKPNNHRLEYFLPFIAFEKLLPGYKSTVVSDVWKKALEKSAAGK